MNLSEQFLSNATAIHQRALQAFFAELEGVCEGAIAVDKRARIVWINSRYVQTLGLASAEEALGRDIEEVIPNSLMRQVVETGVPILLDIMEFGDRSFVVTRMPLFDDARNLVGAIGVVLYDRLHFLKPLVDKFGKLQGRFAQLQRQLATARRPKYALSTLIGASPQLRELKHQAKRAAQLDAPVLLIGETGTGKELFAHAIHGESPRAAGPLVAVNTAAVPETLMEAEFFGVAPGAFTGAERRGREGKVKLADGGTLFLDEVGDMPLALQPKLLRVLQEQEIEPLGSDKVVKVDVRVIAATTVDLRKMVAEGRFRSDLFYRLNVLPLHVPPLRERLSDLQPLAEHVLGLIAERIGLARREIAPSAIEALARYDWPGNVRELRNVLEQVVLRSDNVRLGADDIVAVLPAPSAQPAPEPGRLGQPYVEALRDFEAALIRSALRECGDNVEAAAKSLGVSRATLYKRLAKLRLLSPTLPS